ncbi:MAG: (2Fe-2S)-binding protein [Planctomycetes bacterium]|nr:(2Fe-2S)-binding protein [Planctomycetota bacterium]
MINLLINNQKVQIEDNKTVLDACQKAGIKIPTLCHHKELTGYGSCRLCQVEVAQKNKSRIAVSCLFPASEGLQVQTHTPRVEKNRKLLIELLLARSPEAKILQKMADDYKIIKPRFRLKSEKCILCGMCVRVCNEVLGINAIGFAGRGTSKHIEIPFKDVPENCLGCGACTYVCPTGAIQMETEARQRWAQYLESGARKCRFSRMGLIPHKICPNAFQCQRCEVDQRLEDTYGTHPAFIARPAAEQLPMQVDQVEMIPDYLYTHSHIWVKPLGKRFRIGIDDFAARFIGKVDSITPQDSFRPDRPVWELASGKRTLNMYVPFAGRTMEMNPLVKFVPSLAGKDPYQQGWIYTISAENNTEALNALMSADKAIQVVHKHSDRLRTQTDKALGATLPDGAAGMLGDVPNRLTDEEWQTLTKEFFR